MCLNLFHEFEKLQKSTETLEFNLVIEEALKIKNLCLRKIEQRDFQNDDDFFQYFHLIFLISSHIFTTLSKKSNSNSNISICQIEQNFFIHYNEVVEPIFRFEYFNDFSLHPVFIEILRYFSLFSHYFTEYTIENPLPLAFAMPLFRCLLSEEQNIKYEIFSFQNGKESTTMMMLNLGIKIFCDFSKLNDFTFDIDWGPALTLVLLFSLPKNIRNIENTKNISFFEQCYDFIIKYIHTINLGEVIFLQNFLEIITFNVILIKDKNKQQIDNFIQEKDIQSILNLFEKEKIIIDSLLKNNITSFLHFLLTEKPIFPVLVLVSLYKDLDPTLNLKQYYLQMKKYVVDIPDFFILNYILEKSKKPK